jgi:hypothetical protein
MTQAATTIPPEVLFHRYFQNRPNLLREGYRGKADLDRLPARVQLPVPLLESLQQMLNEALRHENRSIPEHVDHDRFHFDYVDSDEPNALAFCADRYSFIGITIPLVEQLWQACVRLSESQSLTDAADIQLADAERAEMTASQRIQVAVFRLELFFVVLHEFTHVVHGHVPQQAFDGFSNEVLVRGLGSLQHQARESDADGYAVYFMLANVIDSAHERAHLLGILRQTDKPIETQDQVLVWLFVAAVGAFFFTRTPQDLSVNDPYTLTHPPQAARMNLVMKAVQAWCVQNRPQLVDWLTRQRFQDLMRAVAAAIREMNGDRDWSEQVRFLQTPAGAAYFRRLDDALIEEVKRLGGRPGGRV